MTFSTEKELKKNISIHKRLAAVSLLSILSAIISAALFILFLISDLFIGVVICFLLCVLCVASAVAVSRYYKKETAEPHCPYEIILENKFDYDEIKQVFSQKTAENRCRDFQNESAFVCFLKLPLNNRILVINTPRFDKSNFDSAKKNINRTVNKECQISHWISRDRARKMMRTNIIAADEINEALYRFISGNARALLRRTEGVINFAIVGDRLIIPPLFGEADIMEIYRYKQSIESLIKLLK